MSSLHECKWHGVSCTIFEGMIDELDLSNNNVRGSLLSELGELRGLERLVRFKVYSIHIDVTYFLK